MHPATQNTSSANFALIELCELRIGGVFGSLRSPGPKLERTRDSHRLHQYNEECRAARLAQQARAAQLYKMGAKYREQPEWQVRRVQALTRAGYKWQTCSSRDTTLDAHHNSYQTYGDERPQDLVVLCRSCHQKVHGFVEDAS
jgi:5-methylcytosine-specific restriction endonuclease McrA